MQNIKVICSQFNINTPLKLIKPLDSGHINDTYLVTQDDGLQFIVQKLNNHVFKNIEPLICNKVLISTHLKTYYEQTNSNYQTTEFLKTITGSYYYQLDDTYWNVMKFIPNCHTIERATNKNLVYEAGKLYGNFIAATQTLKTESLTETLKDFHSVPLRFSQFEKSLKNVSEERKLYSRKYIDFAFGLKNDMFLLSKLKNDNKFPIRITHNDAKLSNILFDKKQ